MENRPEKCAPGYVILPGRIVEDAITMWQERCWHEYCPTCRRIMECEVGKLSAAFDAAGRE